MQDILWPLFLTHWTIHFFQVLRWIVFAFSEKPSAENSMSSADSRIQGIQLLDCMLHTSGARPNTAGIVIHIKLPHVHTVSSVAGIYCNLLQSFAIWTPAHKLSVAKFPTFTQRPLCAAGNLLHYCAKNLQDLPSLKILQLNILPCKSHKTHIHWISKFSRSSQKWSHSGRTPENSLVDSFPIQCTSLSLQLGCTLLT